ncbi:MAG TPA: glycosyltransferase [Tepidiformaceae bacterium]|nr:glycosyltransferase [Tepidiformaceae bacterium]
MSDSAAVPRVDIVLPVYNEVTVLEASVTTLLAFLDGQPQYDWRIVIADNGSTDGTGDLARTLATRDPRVRALVLTIKGRGYALRDAWVESDANIVSYMDIDLSTDIKHIPRLIDMVAHEGCDVAIGSRLAKGAQTKRQIKREITSRGYVLLIRAFFPRLRITDAQCGFKALSQRTVKNVVPRIKNGMWFFDTELLVLAQQQGLKICELPVHWIEDPDTKVHILKTAIEDVRGLIRMRFRNR